MSNKKITDPAAQVAEGDRNYNSEGTEKDFAQAVHWYTKAAEQGYAQGQYYLGYCYYAGEGVLQDISMAVQWYAKAAEQGHAKAQQKMGNCYYYCEGVEQDIEKAVHWYTKSAEQGVAFAQYMIGFCYYSGEGKELDFLQAVHWFTKAAEQNESAAQCILGFCYYYGYGVDQDYEQAVFWWTKSAEQGDSTAQYHLGDCYYDGEGIEEDHEKAVFWYAKAAEQDDEQAQFKLAYRYLKGEGVECDSDKAIYWYTKSAEKGFDRAQFCLGICYSHGEGIEKDLEKAVYWYTKAAEQGNADSCIELAEMYFRGEDVKWDTEKGAYWFRKAAETGEPKPMLQYGKWLLGDEDCLPQDKAEALRWIEKAADENEHEDSEVLWEARWTLAEIFEYGLYKITKNIKKAMHYYQLLVENGDDSAAVYFKLLSDGKEDPVHSRGWSIKHLVARILINDFPEFDAASALYEKEPDYSGVEFTNEEKKACLPVAERIMELFDIARVNSILVFAAEAEKEEDIYFKTALKMAADGIRADLFSEVINVLFIKEKPAGAALLQRFIIHRGIYLIIRGDFTANKLKVLLGSLYVPHLLLPRIEERKYKMTFNYLLTHREIPGMYFEAINDFYEKILPDPQMMQRFLFFAYNRSKYLASENPDIEPAFGIEKFDISIYEETKGRSVLVITLPQFDFPPDTYQIAIPTARQKAGYFTCEQSVDPMTGEPCFIFGEWNAEKKHNNYGKIEITNENSFAQMAVKIAYGKIIEEPPFDRENMMFDTPSMELFCTQCKTTNFIYDDNEPPYICDCCGAELEINDE